MLIWHKLLALIICETIHFYWRNSTPGWISASALLGTGEESFEHVLEHAAYIQTPVLLLMNWMTFHLLLNLAVPQFLHMQNSDDNSTSLISHYKHLWNAFFPSACSCFCTPNFTSLFFIIKSPVYADGHYSLKYKCNNSLHFPLSTNFQ